MPPIFKEQLMEQEIKVYDFKSEGFDKLIEENKIENRMYFFYLPRRVKLTHLITGEEAYIDNLPMCHIHEGSFRFCIVCCGTKEQTIQLAHMHHVNVALCRTEALLTIRPFCVGDYNDVGREDLLKNFTTYLTTLAFQFEQQNPSNAFREPSESLCLFEIEKPVRDMRGYFMDKDRNPMELITRTQLNLQDKSLFLSVKKRYYYKSSLDSYYIPVFSKECAEEHHTSKYYKIITPEDIEEAIKNITITCDALFIGCGSAGSNIATQLSRTNVANSYILNDMDSVEVKNIRNQVFDTYQAGFTKAGCLKEMISRVEKDARCVTSKFQEINVGIKAKYLFNMLDSLLLRKQCVEKFNSNYIIDARYHKLSASIFIIDRSKEDEVKYYNDNLNASIKSNITDYKFDELELYRTFYNVSFRNKIRRICKELDKCYSVLCKRKKKYYDNLPDEYKDKLIQLVDENRQTCNSPNIIDIYTITAGIIVRALAQVSDGKDKPFTHLEIDTQTGLPRLMVVKE